jgi:hypothetical protein
VIGETNLVTFGYTNQYHVAVAGLTFICIARIEWLLHVHSKTETEICRTSGFDCDRSAGMINLITTTKQMEDLFVELLL